MKRFLWIGAAAAAIFSASVPAAAQTVGGDSQLSVRAGIFLPFEDELTTDAEIWFTLGADLELFDLRLLQNATSVISLDWLTESGGGNANAFPIIFNQRWYTGAYGSRTYFQAGIGLAVLDFVPSDTVLAARVGVGMEWKDRYFFEANLYWTDEDESGITGTGVGGYFGIRF